MPRPLHPRRPYRSRLLTPSRPFGAAGPLLLAALVLTTAPGCDSKSRGEQQNAGSTDSDRRTTRVAPRSADRLDGGGSSISEDQPADPPEAPAPGALDRYTSDIEGEGKLIARIITSEGTIRCRLFEDRAPITVANFVGLARGMKEWVDPESGSIVEDEPFYAGVTFHRVIPEFIIQAGDRTGTGQYGPGYSIPDEIEAGPGHREPGTLSMANRGPGTGGSQFFITERPLPHLDGRHTVFGRCKDLEVVRKIARTPAGPENRPETPITIETIQFERGVFQTADEESTPPSDTRLDADD